MTLIKWACPGTPSLEHEIQRGQDRRILFDNENEGPVRDIISTTDQISAETSSRRVHSR